MSAVCREALFCFFEGGKDILKVFFFLLSKIRGTSKPLAMNRCDNLLEETLRPKRPTGSFFLTLWQVVGKFASYVLMCVRKEKKRKHPPHTLLPSVSFSEETCRRRRASPGLPELQGLQSLCKNHVLGLGEGGLPSVWDLHRLLIRTGLETAENNK